MAVELIIVGGVVLFTCGVMIFLAVACLTCGVPQSCFRGTKTVFMKTLRIFWWLIKFFAAASSIFYLFWKGYDITFGYNSLFFDGRTNPTGRPYMSMYIMSIVSFSLMVFLIYRYGNPFIRFLDRCLQRMSRNSDKKK